MNILNLIRLALRALQRNKLRSLLTMLGIIIGVGAVIAMMSIGEGSKQSIEKSLSSMGSNMITISPQSNQQGGARAQGANIQNLTIDDVDAIERSATKISAISPQESQQLTAVLGKLNLRLAELEARYSADAAAAPVSAREGMEMGKRPRKKESDD